MYYPKTQIIENQYANAGEFVVDSSQEPYSGPYFKTSEGRFYSGKNYQDTPNYMLELLSPGTSTQNQSQIEAETKPDSYYIINDGYYAAKNYKVSRLSPRGPKSIIPQPTPQDYQLGEFQRYFLRKPNGNTIIEINQKEFNLFAGHDESVQWQSYQPLQQAWTLTGDTPKDVGNVNFNISTLIEFRFKAYGFVPYFRGKFDQYYKKLG